MALPEDGLIASFTYDNFVDLNQYGSFIDSAKNSEGIGLFVGLTCDVDELKGWVDDPERDSGKVNDLQMMEDDFGQGELPMPNLPGPSIAINTTGEAPEHTVQNILAMLPDDMKGNINF